MQSMRCRESRFGGFSVDIVRYTNYLLTYLITYLLKAEENDKFKTY